MPRPDPRTPIAYHEAGHAVAADLAGVPFHSVTIVPFAPGYGGALFYTAPGPPADFAKPAPPRPASRKDRDRWLYERDVGVSMAGPIAEAACRGRVNRVGLGGDRANAFAVAFQVAPGPALAPWLQFVWARTAEALLEPRAWTAVDLVAEALLRAGTLDAGQVAGLVRGAGRCVCGPALEMAAAARGWLPRSRCPFLARARRRRPAGG